MARPPRKEEWALFFGDNSAAKGWEVLCQQAREATGDAYDILIQNPRQVSKRQHRLKGGLGSRFVAGMDLEQWQYEVTGGGRIWYCVDDDNKRVILTYASTKHPKSTE